MPKNSLNVSLKGADDIFSTEESRQEQQREQVQRLARQQVHRLFCRSPPGPQKPQPSVRQS